MALEAERKQFLDYIRERGLRTTSERMLLFDEIFSKHGHFDVEELLSVIKQKGHKISRATVYRNLDLLVECGLVRKQRLGKDRHLFEHVHRGQRHDHLVCTRCGRVIEFLSPGIEAMQREICRAHGFDPSEHTLQILSVCDACSRVS